MQYVTPHRSPGLTAICNAVKGREQVQVLDLGPCVSANFDFLSQLGCHLHFENLTDQMAFSIAPQSTKVAPLDLPQFLDYIKPKQKFSVVLAWDLLDFIDNEQLAAIIQRLAPHLAPNTLLYSFNYLGARRPAQPAIFRILDQYHISIEYDQSRIAHTTKATTIEWLNAMPNFRAVRSYVNREGMHGGISEQIFCFQPDNAMKNGVFATSELTKSQSQVDVELTSPALSSVLNFAQNHPGARLLDLGGKHLGNEDKWKGAFGEVAVVDFHQVIQRLQGKDKASQLDYIRHAPYLNFPDAKPFDVVMIWDLFNYLDDELLKAFGERLASHVKDSSLLTCLNYNGASIPSQPRKYSLTSAGIGYLNHKATTHIARPSAVLSSLKVQKCLPGFFIKSTYMARPGMQSGTSEYLLVYKDETTLAKEKAALYEEVMARRQLREASTKPPQNVIEL